MIAVLFLLLIASLISYKKTVLFSAVVFMFMNNLSSGIEGVKLYYAIVLAQIVLFYLLGYYKKKKECYPLLILVPTLIAGICYFISSYVGTMHQYGKNAVNIMVWFYYPYIVWHVMSSSKEVIYYGKILISFFFVVTGYAVLEFIIGQNLYSQWADAAGIIAGELGGTEAVERFGLLRCNSILPFCSALGMDASIVFTSLAILITKGKRFFFHEKLLIFLLPLCVLLCGTRSQFIVFTLCFLGLLCTKEYRKSGYMKVLIIIGLAGVVVFSSVFVEIINSILHSDTSSVEGSNTDMRLSQFDIAAYYWLQSPLFGHGRNFTWEVAIPNNPALMGAESIVFTQLIDHGIAGLISFYLIGICLTFWCYRYSRPLAMIPIAFIAGKTMSTVVGVEYNIPIILCIFVVKALILYKDSQYEVEYRARK
ncbi:O-antigen ligase family protein [Phocaeicola sartorii]|uniref:O-antigen ligase-related domain-containing protein n=1 Tax=Phocaeicola sartorii TaxID=671267 RepID=A0A4S2FVH1_9BACT|nr:O-antigen ligase family protein [Phocaeicola sartorii]NBH66527.1 hypothetical protein [Phocaeicola sartorii]TGY73370.1 hypothetical protein E5339_00045 [Phocaeicola sartorii]